MGFIEETGAAQHYRDARIAPIYEGTNGIQAMDLAGRKLSLAGGAGMTQMLAEMRETAVLLHAQRQCRDPRGASSRRAGDRCLGALDRADEEPQR